MYVPTRRSATALAISAALLVAGCSGSGDKSSTASGSDQELFLQPVAAAGPDPFTESTANSDAASPPVTRTPQPSPSGTSPSATQQGIRSISGATPGLYGGTQNVASCNVEKQIDFLTGEQAKARAFAQAAGIKQDTIPGYLRGLTPVQLRGDTRVTNHGYRNGQPTNFQSVLQSGTAVLVDGRGMPRVRCACGNPLTPPAALKGNPSHQGKAWNGYHPTKVVVVTPAPTVINNITIINITNNTWIERPIGDDGNKDKVVPKPKPTPPSPPPTDPTPTDETTDPTDEPSDETTDPTDDPTDETTDPTDEPTDEPSTESTEPTAPTTPCPTVQPTDAAGQPSPVPDGCPPVTSEPVPPPAPDDNTEQPSPPPPDENTAPAPEDRTDVPNEETVPDQPTQDTVPDQPTEETVPDQPTDEGIPDPLIPEPSEPDTFNG
ncbi:DUF6777 domain-containing protein [Streptomyces monticola]|uniref:DUF6777 domain-containing protein n=1 Tax=Streptomyces monticola TaxID=2666263 RepID=A0ABW2JW21_9ACTN